MIMLMKMMIMMVMVTTMTSQVKASSGGSSTGVSVREPLNVRLQRLLSSDQSSAYTILDILQVCFLFLFVLENVKSISLHGQAPRTSQAEIIKFLRGVTQRIEEEARRGVRESSFLTIIHQTLRY